jgi:hypothetical protein
VPSQYHYREVHKLVADDLAGADSEALLTEIMLPGTAQNE